MAVELIRVVWCDICLKRDKTQTPGEENAVPGVVEGRRLKKIDLCEPHRKELTYDEILEFGDFVDKPLNSASARGQTRRSPALSPTVDPDAPPPAERDPRLWASTGVPRAGNLKLGQCSACGKIMAMRAQVHHTKAHKRRGERPGKLLPLEE